MLFIHYNEKKYSSQEPEFGIVMEEKRKIRVIVIM